jgi:hypothetical protein
MSDDPAQDRITAVIRAITTLTTNQPNIVGFDSSDYQYVFREGGRAVFGEGEAAGPPKEGRATRAAEAAIADLKRKFRQPEQKEIMDQTEEVKAFIGRLFLPNSRTSGR